MFTKREIVFGVGFVTMLVMNVACGVETLLHEKKQQKANKQIQEDVQGCIDILEKTED